MARNKFSLSKSIYRQLLFAFVLVALTPALVISVVSAWSSYQIGQQRTLDQLDSVVTLKSAEIDMWTNELSVGLDTLVDEDDLSQVVLPLLEEQLSPAAVQQAHSRFLKNMNLVLAKNRLFDRVCLMDENGKVIFSTDTAYENLDFSDTNFFQQGLQKSFIAPPFRNLPQDQYLTIIVSRPIVAPGQGAVGVISTYSDISVLDRIMKEPTGLGQTGESYLVGADYDPITPVHFQTNPSITQIKSDGIRLAIENKIHNQGLYRDYRDEPVIGVYTWLPALQVALIVEQDQAEAFGPVTTLLGMNLGVALAATAFTVFIAFLVTRSIATPITILSKTATQIAEGDLYQVADVKRQDEIGKLAQAFNLMTAQLRNLIERLQAELFERKRAETERQTLLEIMQGLMLTADVQAYLRLVHLAIAKVVFAENFYIIFKNKNTGLFEEIYSVDKYDPPAPPSLLEKSVSSYVFRSGEPLLLTQERFEKLVNQGEVALVGSNSLSWLGVPLKTSKETIGVMAVQDYDRDDRYSEREKEFMASIAGQVAQTIEHKRAEIELKENKDKLELLFDILPVGVSALDNGRKIVKQNKALEEILSISKDGLENGDYRNRKYLRADGTTMPMEEFASTRVFQGESAALNVETGVVKEDGSVTWVNVSAIASPFADWNAVMVTSDITERKQVEEKIQRQLEHLATLSMIDSIITSSFDLHNNLDAILTYTIQQLGVDAASILILDSNSLILNYNAWRGFRTKTVEKAQVWLGESCAGKVAREHNIIQITDLKEYPNDPFLKNLFREEGFVSYYGVPLLVKGKALGVLEVFHRAPFHPNQEWLDFLNTLAGQTAIAIDNSQLFDGLQRSNLNLTLAYDATIEGWSRAMDLRDKETEGHTQRVAELTLRLARALDVDEAELIHLRRGALLHDIGKLSVPDSILLKPGKLTKKEMETMRCHPIYAYEMLIPIAYLKPAIDIPYCHHEKWDGTGYPRGLKGEDIPLAARLFAVVDVWDALSSARHYRAAWSLKKVRRYFREQSGKHFDPRIAATFQNLIDKK